MEWSEMRLQIEAPFKLLSQAFSWTHWLSHYFFFFQMRTGRPSVLFLRNLAFGQNRLSSRIWEMKCASSNVRSAWRPHRATSEKKALVNMTLIAGIRLDPKVPLWVLREAKQQTCSMRTSMYFCMQFCKNNTNRLNLSGWDTQYIVSPERESQRNTWDYLGVLHVGVVMIGNLQ